MLNCIGFLGLLSELQDVACKVLNCTWEIIEPQDEYGWGVKPISGPYNQSGIWGGVMGGIINGDYMLSLSTWIWLIERNDLVDFVPNGYDKILLALTPQRPKIDFGLFVRPFTNQAWHGIAATFAIILACIILPYMTLKGLHYSRGRII